MCHRRVLWLSNKTSASERPYMRQHQSMSALFRCAMRSREEKRDECSSAATHAITSAANHLCMRQ